MEEAAFWHRLRDMNYLADFLIIGVYWEIIMTMYYVGLYFISILLIVLDNPASAYLTELATRTYNPTYIAIYQNAISILLISIIINRILYNDKLQHCNKVLIFKSVCYM